MKRSPSPQQLRGANIGYANVPPHCGGEGRRLAACPPSPSQWGGAGGGASWSGGGLGGFLRTAWWWVQEYFGEHDYDRYLAHWRAHHPELPPLSRRAFFERRLEITYGGNVQRCC